MKVENRLNETCGVDGHRTRKPSGCKPGAPPDCASTPIIVILVGLEPTTYRLEICRSIQMSYRTVKNF